MRKITDDQKSDFLAWLRAGARPARAARLAGVGESTTRKLRKKDPEFDAACRALVSKPGGQPAADPETIKVYLRAVADGAAAAAACRQLGFAYTAFQPSRVSKRDPLFAMKIDLAKRRGRLARQICK